MPTSLMFPKVSEPKENPIGTPQIDMAKYADMLKYAAYKALKLHGGKWIPANQVNNLISSGQPLGTPTGQEPHYDNNCFYLPVKVVVNPMGTPGLIPEGA